MKQNYKKYADEINIEDIVARKITSNYLNTLSNTINVKNNELIKKENLLVEVRLDLLNKQIEKKSLEKLKEMGVTFDVRKVPADSKENMDSLLKKAKTELQNMK